MKKSGKTNRDEPTDLSWVDNFLECAELFSNTGWLTFFKRIDGYHAKVSHKFSHCYDKDIVSFDTLQLKMTKELVAEATDILNEGELWLRRFHSPSMHKSTYFLV